MRHIEHICGYINFLKQTIGLKISIHPMKQNNVIDFGKLIKYNIHESVYCVYVKTSKAAHNKCLECQQKSVRKCENGDFTGVCHAGVYEYVYPLYASEEVIGFISVSGYKVQNPDIFFDTLHSKYGLSKERLINLYGELSDNIPNKSFIDSLIFPLCDMLELSLSKSSRNEAEPNILDRIIFYLQNNHGQKITLNDLCNEFYCSPSFLSHNFKKHTGKNINEFLNELRIKDAKALLKKNGLSITEIALSVGFDDSNYFSEVFRKLTGMSPREYRKTITERGK